MSYPTFELLMEIKSRELANDLSNHNNDDLLKFIDELIDCVGDPEFLDNLHLRINEKHAEWQS